MVGKKKRSLHIKFNDEAAPINAVLWSRANLFAQAFDEWCCQRLFPSALRANWSCVSRPCVLSIQIASCLSAVLVGCCSLACVCVPFWELRSGPWQNTFLPFLVPVQDGPPPTKGEFCVRSCLCVRVLCLAKCLVARVFSGCFRARSASTACMLACGRVCVCVCAPALWWVMTQRKDSEHTVLNSTEGPRDKYNSAQHFFLCRSLLQSFHHLSVFFSLLSLSLTLLLFRFSVCARLHYCQIKGTALVMCTLCSLITHDE